MNEDKLAYIVGGIIIVLVILMLFVAGCTYTRLEDCKLEVSNKLICDDVGRYEVLTGKPTE